MKTEFAKLAIEYGVTKMNFTGINFEMYSHLLASSNNSVSFERKLFDYHANKEEKVSVGEVKMFVIETWNRYIYLIRESK